MKTSHRWERKVCGMDRIKLAQAIRTKQRIKSKSNYLEYVKLTHPGYQNTLHGELITGKIQAAIEQREKMISGEIPETNQYLMFSIPPRHGKSMTITETLPSYCMGKYKGFKCVLTAYSTTLANDFDLANTNKTKEFNVFNVRVNTSNQERTIYSNGSACVKAGILGGITGKGANLMIIDDPIKTAEEAASDVRRDKIWKEWTASLSTRLEPPAIVIVIMTRWHEDDLCGRLLNPEYGKPLPWDVVNLPLEAEEGDVLGREVGEPLWKERYGYDFIEMRKNYPQEFNALYQGRPTAAEGNMIKKEWFESDDAWYTQTPQLLRTIPNIVMSVDATFKDTSKSDKVAIGVWGKMGNTFYLIDELNARMDFLATLQAIKNLKAQYPRIGMVFIEDKANGSAIINVLSKELMGVIPVNPLGGKEARLQSVLPYLVSNVRLPRHKTFTQTMLAEWYSFPNGTHDDSVDEMTQALSQMIYYYGDVAQTRAKTIKEEFFGVEKEQSDSLVGDIY